MELSIRTEEIRKTELEMIKEFCDRYESTLVKKSPEEIIAKFLDWQYNRFKVRDDADNNVYILYDFKKYEPVMIVSKHIPDAYHCVYDMCDKLNNIDEEDLIEHENRVDFKNFFHLLDNIYSGDDE